MYRRPELRVILLECGRDAKLLLEIDQQSADQILQIHGVCRALRIKSPVDTFETRATAVG